LEVWFLYSLNNYEGSNRGDTGALSLNTFPRKIISLPP
jgi:hypothetical protein